MATRFPSLRWFVLAAALAAAGFGSLMVYARTSQASPGPQTPFNPATWQWVNEEHWAVDQMAADIVEMAFAAAGRDPGTAKVTTTPAGPRCYRLTLQAPGWAGGYETRLDLKTFLWNPETFSTLAADLVGKLGLHPSGRSQPAALDALLTPDPVRLDQAQAKLSRALQADPACAALHDQAALALGMFGLFDHSAAFEDHRAVMGRMAAHLALARGLRPGTPGPEGRLAGLALLTLAGRKAQAAGELAAMDQDPGLPAPWRNTLAVLSTEDFRRVPDPGPVSLAEALASFRSRSLHQGANGALAWLTEPGRPDLPMGFAARVTMTGNYYSVENGHHLTAQALPSDLRDLQSLLAAHGRRPASPAEACKALNAHPGRCWDPASRSLEVIGWGLWAQRFQATLLCDMMQAISFNAHHYGSKEATNQYLDQIEAAFGGLEQFPILQKRYSDLRPAAYDPAMRLAVKLCQDHPECLSDCSLVCLHQPPPGQSVPRSLPRYQDWLALPEPFGTAYNWSFRTWEMAERKRLSLAELVQYLQLDPANDYLESNYLQARYPDGHYQAEGVEVACAGSKAFDRIGYLRKLLATLPDEDPGSLPMLRELADLDSGWLGTLGRDLVLWGQPEQASAAFLAMFRRHPDRVAVSNSMLWEVLHLQRTGQLAKAEEIASECAEVYSATGLQTLAVLREVQGRFQEAEACYLKIRDRYQDTVGLDAFHCRNAGRDARFARLWEERRARLFPQGLVRFDPAQVPARPSQGALFTSVTRAMTRWGLAKDAVVVGLDGYRVDNCEQYYLIRALKWEDDMSLVVHQGGGYQTIQAKPNRRRFGVDMKDFDPKG